MLENVVANFLDTVRDEGIDVSYDERDIENAMGNAYMWDMMQSFIGYANYAIHILKCKIEELTECTPNKDSLAENLRADYESLPSDDAALYDKLYDMINVNNSITAYLANNLHSSMVKQNGNIHAGEVIKYFVRTENIDNILFSHDIHPDRLDEYISDAENFRCNIAEKLYYLAEAL